MVSLPAERPIKEYSVWDGPVLYVQVFEPGVDPNTWIPADVTGWTAVLTMTPREGGIGVLAVPIAVASAQEGIFSYQIPGGRLPTDPLPQITIPGSFYRPMTLDCYVRVVTAPPDGSPIEHLRCSPFTIVVNP